METLPYPIGSTKFHSLPSHRTRLRVNSISKPIFNRALHSHLIRFKPLSPPLKFQNLRFSQHRCVANASDHHDHDHEHHHHNHHHHHHCDEGTELSGPQRALIGFAKAIRWMDLSNFLRENLQLCCCSAALFLAAAACPYIVPKPAVKSLQNAFMLVAFPLVGVIFKLIAIELEFNFQCSV